MLRTVALHSQVRGTWRPDWSRAIGDDKNVKLKASRHAVYLLAHRARITIDIDVSQLPALSTEFPDSAWARKGKLSSIR
jgi:hypothetical protein